MCFEHITSSLQTLHVIDQGEDDLPHLIHLVRTGAIPCLTKGKLRHLRLTNFTFDEDPDLLATLLKNFENFLYALGQLSNPASTNLRVSLCIKFWTGPQNRHDPLTFPENVVGQFESSMRQRFSHVVRDINILCEYIVIEGQGVCGFLVYSTV